MTGRARPSRRTLRASVDGPATLVVMGLVGLCLPAGAQGLSVAPTFSITETLTDNRDVQATRKQSDLISQISPGLSVSARSGSLQGSLNYSANGLVYARDSSLNTVFHSLSSAATLQLLDGRAGVSATASAGRQAVSAFGTQGADPALNSGNQAQVFSYSLSPYLSGRLLGDTAYQVRLAYSSSSSAASTVGGASAIGDASSLTLSAGLSGRRGRIAWGVDASRGFSEQGATPRTLNGRVGASLSFSPDIEWQLALRAGSEVDDRQAGGADRSTTWGAGLTWTPGPRTSLRFDTDRRFFGRTHGLNFSHRMARTIWTASDSRSLNQSGTSGRLEASAYDRLFALLASVQPDPVQRDALVRSILAADPQGGAGVVVGGFQSATATVQRSQSLSLAYQGLRATFTVAASRSDSRPLSGTSASGDFALASRVRQQGLSVGLSHRLTPQSTLVLSASRQRTDGSGAQSGNDLQTLLATWSSRLGPYTNASLGLRHTRFDSELNPYQESALIGSIRMQF